MTADFTPLHSSPITALLFFAGEDGGDDMREYILSCQDFVDCRGVWVV